MARKSTREGRMKQPYCSDEQLMDDALAMNTFDPRIVHELFCRNLIEGFVLQKNNIHQLENEASICNPNKTTSDHNSSINWLAHQF